MALTALRPAVVDFVQLATSTTAADGGHLMLTAQSTGANSAIKVDVADATGSVGSETAQNAEDAVPDGLAGAAGVAPSHSWLSGVFHAVGDDVWVAIELEDVACAVRSVGAFGVPIYPVSAETVEPSTALAWLAR